ncbi:unnamed protein product [Paramecium pentaurelia]|uniref:PPM-type phosphatase domain-containing protein n=1 Tax=Paramecium pentaurelia TaxID=43138 RepID=A0A8S1T5H3_9CILI|nr:unnamed protein product [Paramecium pentaurelia]
MLTQSQQNQFDFKTRQTSQIDFSSLKPPRHPQGENQIEQHRTQKPLLQKRYKITSNETEQRNHKISLPSLANFRKTEFNSIENKIGLRIPNRLPKLENRNEISKSKYEIQLNQTPKDEEQQKPKTKQKKISYTPEQRISESPEKNSSQQSKKKKGQKQLKGIKFVHNTKAGCQVNKQIKTNQDAAIIFPQNIQSQNYGLIGICDGHGVNGHLVSDIIRQRLPIYLEFQLQSQNPDMEECFKNAFELTNSEILQSQFDTALSGSTTVLAMIQQNQLWTANVGDSRAILCRNCNGWKSMPLTRDHKPSDESEKQRILQAGGRIHSSRDFYGNDVGPVRVWLSYVDAPGLAMTRSMGDKIGAQAGVSSIPEVFQFTLSQNDKFLVIASDGVWEYLSNEDVMNIIVPYFEEGELEQAGEKLMMEAINSWKKNSPGRDDITFIIQLCVVKLIYQLFIDMSLHFQYLGQGLSSQKTMELLQKHCSSNDYNKIADFGAVFDELLEQQKYKELIVSTLDIINLSQDKTLLQPIYSAIQYWMTKLESKEQQIIIDLFLQHIEQINVEAIFKTKIVAQLFNALSSSSLSQNLFLKLIECAKKWNTQQLIISPIISNIKEFLNLWTLSDPEILKILNAISELIDPQDQQYVIQISEYILRNINTSQEQYIKTFINFQNINQSFLKLCEITQCSNYQVIEKTQVAQLIKLVLNGDLSAVQAFLVKEEVYFKQINLNVEQYLNQTRIAKFIQLSSQKQSYSYQEIAVALNIKLEEVEIWVIHAIQSQNVSAQIDQSQQRIFILDNFKKLLTKDDWQNLHKKLSALLTKLKNVQTQ